MNDIVVREQWDLKKQELDLWNISMNVTPEYLYLICPNSIAAHLVPWKAYKMWETADNVWIYVTPTREFSERSWDNKNSIELSLYTWSHKNTQNLDKVQWNISDFLDKNTLTTQSLLKNFIDWKIDVVSGQVNIINKKVLFILDPVGIN